ncbi:MAG TPA: TonB-dependent receptor [Terracidiphilus sp.]|nr:TonB-dependent receptor [Terracidiphilus sp.]
MTAPAFLRTFDAIPRFKLITIHICAFLVALAMSAPDLHAQFRGSIQGTVTDPSGAVVPDANLTLKNPATNDTHSVTSNGEGVYAFNGLPPGTFILTVEHSGFDTKTYDNVRIIPEQANSFNVQLTVSSAAPQTVTVNAGTIPLIDTANGTIATTISSNEVEHMPSFGRDAFQLMQLAPGTIGDRSQSAGGGSYSLPGTQGPGGPSSNTGIFATENGPQTLANGNQYENNSISIDGISTVSAVWGGTSIVTPTEESVDNVHVVTNAYDAEYGRFAGAQVEVTSKEGTNSAHGSAFFQRWSPGMNAYQRYNGPSFYSTNCGGPNTSCTPSQRGLTKDTQQFNQYGASLGGPLWRDHLFAFFAYEAERSGVNQVTSTAWYDTPAFDMLAPSGSIASQYLSFPGAGVSGTLVPVSCADAGLTEGVNCNTIPGQGLNIGSPLTTPPGTQDPTWSGASSPGVGGGLSNVADIAEYTTLNPTQISDDQYNGRVDAQLTPNDRLTGTIYWVLSNTTDYNGPVRPMNFWHHDVATNAVAAIWNHVFTSNFLNEARANAAGWRFNEVATNPQAPFGLPQDNIQQIGSIPSSQFQYFGSPGPSQLDQWTYTYRDIATWSHGKHDVKFGGELTRLYYLNQVLYAARPTFTFFNIWDFLNDAPQAESGTFDPTTGMPSAARQDDRENLWGFFVQDDFKVTPSLTLNMGLRYDYFGSLYAKQGDMYGVRLGAGQSLMSGLTVQRLGNLWAPEKGNFGPEFGFAFSPAQWKSKLVVRGGYGLNFNQEEIALTANVFNNPGVTVSPNFVLGTPSSPNPGILYSTASNIHSLFGYPANPAVVSSSTNAFGANGLPTTGATSVTVFPAKFPTTYVQHYSLETDYDLGLRSVLTVGYSGSVGRHTIFNYDLNAVAAVDGLPLNPQVNSATYFSNGGHSSYNSMLVSLKHQMSHGFTATADFNWARSMDTSSGPYEKQYYPYDPSLSYGRSDYDVGKLLKLYGMWQPVFFHGNHTWAEKIAGGWNLSGIFNIHTGFPWAPVFPVAGNLYCNACGYSTLLPSAYLGGAGHDTSNDAYKSGPGVGNNTNANFPNGGSAYFTAPTYTVAPAFPATGAAAPQRPGIDRNSFTGPGYRSLDATLSKTFGVPKLHEGAGLQIRADVFNVFNNLNFRPGGASSETGGGIADVVSAPNFGQAQSALSGRIMTLQARFDF